MLKFNEKTMKKAVVAEEFAVEDENFCISRTGGYDSVMAKPGMELWVINEFECENYDSTEMSLCWIPKFGFAATLASEFVDYIPTESQEGREALDMIDTTSKQVESLAKGDGIKWKNGDYCQHKNGVIFTFIGKCDNPKEFDCVLMDSSGNTVLSFINELSKPESPEQKAERERLEAAYDLWLTWCHGCDVDNSMSIDQFATLGLCPGYLAIVDKTVYRKESK